MKCKHCGEEMTIKDKKIGEDEFGEPIYQAYAFCYNCKIKRKVKPEELEAETEEDEDDYDYEEAPKRSTYSNIPGETEKQRAKRVAQERYRAMRDAENEKDRLRREKMEAKADRVWPKILITVIILAFLAVGAYFGYTKIIKPIYIDPPKEENVTKDADGDTENIKRSTNTSDTTTDESTDDTTTDGTTDDTATDGTTTDGTATQTEDGTLPEQ